MIRGETSGPEGPFSFAIDVFQSAPPVEAMPSPAPKPRTQTQLFTVCALPTLREAASLANSGQEKAGLAPAFSLDRIND